MPRKYELKARAERQAETRRRIVEAAIELHGEIGPARATVSAIAERAGVERHTYYRHFPDERSLLLACSGHDLELNPLPDPGPWREIADPHERLERGLSELYGYYSRREQLLANVLRDAEVHAPTREVNRARLEPPMAAIRDALAEGIALGADRRRVLAAIDLALDFGTWRTLVRGSRLSKRDAVGLMAQSIACAASSKRR